MTETQSPRSTREALLAAGLRVVADGGIGASTSRRITAEADANLASITYHFGSKEALLSEALLGAAKRWLMPVLAQLDSSDGDPIARTGHAFAALQGVMPEVLPLLPAYFEAMSPTTPLPKVRRGISRLLGQIHGFIESAIAVQVADGEVPDWVDPDAMASLQMAVVHGIAFQSLLGGKDGNAGAMAQQFLQLLAAAKP